MGDCSPSMSLADRIRKRLDALGLSAASVSRDAGLGRDYLRDVLNGKSQNPSAQSIALVAPLLKTSLGYLMTGAGDEEVEPIEVRAYVGAGAVITRVTDDAPLERVEAPPGATGIAGAAIVRGTSQLPALRDGDVVFWGEQTDDPSAYINLECVCILSNDQWLVKTLLPGSRKGLYTLISHNAEPIHDAEVVAASPILWVRRSMRR